MRKIYLEKDVSQPRPCVATVGFFDGVHLGHQFLISKVVDEARKRGMDAMIVTFDNHPRQVVDDSFHPQLLTTNDEKLVRLATTGVDCCAVLHFDAGMAAMSAREFMEQVLGKRLSVRCLIIGYDNRFGRHRSEGFDDYVRYGAALGIDVMACDPFVFDDGSVSSSAVRKALSEGDMERASRYLGSPYILTGHVVEGFQQGRKLGFPTANIVLDDARKLIPPIGVYAVKVRLSGSMEMRRGVMNIGYRPTFSGDDISLEVHLINYEGDLYGLRMMVALCHRLRGERKFENTGLLAAQMKEDVREANAMFDKEMEQ